MLFLNNMVQNNLQLENNIKCLPLSLQLQSYQQTKFAEVNWHTFTFCFTKWCNCISTVNQSRSNNIHSGLETNTRAIHQHAFSYDDAGWLICQQSVHQK